MRFLSERKSKPSVVCASPNNIVSFSGGKDSTAMLHMMLDRGEPIAEVVFFDTGWEFPEMYEHIRSVEAKTGLRITRLRPELPFEYWMFQRPIVARKGPAKGRVHRIGNGWPSPSRRWCTRIKVDAISKRLSCWDSPVCCIGMAVDEIQRTQTKSQRQRSYAKRYPLIEYDVDEAEALAYCRRFGYDWGGLYDLFPRVSCFCCPLQRIGELRRLRRHRPHQWKAMLKMDRMAPEHNRGFRNYDTVDDLERRFQDEDRLAKQLRSSRATVN
jgi:3'-phosphoadenosine 5'-phosphosulfate sulfotransferase (PAPS reductase)/FAD synthetase